MPASEGSAHCSRMSLITLSSCSTRPERLQNGQKAPRESMDTRPPRSLANMFQFFIQLRISLPVTPMSNFNKQFVKAAQSARGGVFAKVENGSGRMKLLQRSTTTLENFKA